jgi:hypothetical protein
VIEVEQGKDVGPADLFAGAERFRELIVFMLVLKDLLDQGICGSGSAGTLTLGIPVFRFVSRYVQVRGSMILMFFPTSPRRNLAESQNLKY